MSKEELKPCPFCGSEGEVEIDPCPGSSSLVPYKYVVCSNNDCFMRMGAEASYITIEEWNTRASVEGE